jgi:type IV secretion system protein VirB6
LPLSLSIAASIAGGHALQNVQPWTRGPLAQATQIVGRGLGYGASGAAIAIGAGYRQLQSQFAGPAATMSAGGNTVQGAASGDPRAEVVAAALIESRRMQLKEMRNAQR